MTQPQQQTRTYSPSFQITGALDLKRDLERSAFQEALTELFVEAGLSGTFTMVALRTTKGSTHTKGLRIISPSQVGAQLTWHEGSNDRNIMFMIRTPSRLFVDTASFNAKLLDAHARVTIRARVLPEKPAAPKKEEIEKAVPNAEPVVSAPAPVPEQEILPVTCAIDESTGELIVVEAMKYCNDRKQTPRRKVLDVLVDLKYGPTMRGPAMRSLITSGHFDPCDAGDFLVLGRRWCEKYPEHAPAVTAVAEALAPKRSAEELSPDRVERAEAAETAKAKPNPQQKLARLMRLAAEAAVQRKRLAQIEEEQAAVERVFETYRTRLEELALDKQRIEAELNKPELREAEARLALIQEQLE